MQNQCYFRYTAWLRRPNFWVHDSKGSAETLARGGITNHHLIAYSLSNISAKKLPKLVNVRWSYIVQHQCRSFWLYWTDFHELFTKWKVFAWIFLIQSSFLIPLGIWQPILDKICEMTFIQHAGILQRIRISQFGLRGDKGHNFSTFCAILVMIGPLTPKISHGVSVPFGMKRQKSTYHTKYLNRYWTELHQLFSIGGCRYVDYKTNIFCSIWRDVAMVTN